MKVFSAWAKTASLRKQSPELENQRSPGRYYYMMEIELNLTHWSDGRFVSADDFVFAWKRLLEPNSE